MRRGKEGASRPSPRRSGATESPAPLEGEGGGLLSQRKSLPGQSLRQQKNVAWSREHPGRGEQLSGKGQHFAKCARGWESSAGPLGPCPPALRCPSSSSCPQGRSCAWSPDAAWPWFALSSSFWEVRHPEHPISSSVGRPPSVSGPIPLGRRAWINAIRWGRPVRSACDEVGLGRLGVARAVRGRRAGVLGAQPVRPARPALAPRPSRRDGQGTQATRQGRGRQPVAAWPGRGGRPARPPLPGAGARRPRAGRALLAVVATGQSALGRFSPNGVSDLSAQRMRSGR